MADCKEDCLINLSWSDPGEAVLCSNPFDSIALQAENYDPFEMVYRSAYSTPNTQVVEETPISDKVVQERDCCLGEKDVEGNYENLVEMFLNSDDNCVNTSDNLANGGRNKVAEVNWESLANNNHSDDLPMLPQNRTSCSDENNKDSSFSSLDMTNENTIRASIAKRIDKCVKNVLNSTTEKKLACSKTGLLNSSENLNLKPQKRAKSVDVTSPVEINRSFQFGDSDEFDRAFCYVTSNSRYSTPTKSKAKSNDLSINDMEDDVFLENQVESKKLADTFKEMSLRARRWNSNSSYFDLNCKKEEDGFDLLSEKVTWDPVDSSDEEADLCNDPALNLRCTTGSVDKLPTPKKNVEFSDVVINYMKRRSLDLNSSTVSLNNESAEVPTETNMKRSNSFSCVESGMKKMQAVNISKPNGNFIKKPIAALEMHEDAIMEKLKGLKVQVNIKKKGPLRAVMPIQSMIRPSLPKGVKKSMSPKCNFNITSGDKSPKKRNAISRPAASSTPNKILFPRSSPATSPILAVAERPLSSQQLNRNSFDSSNVPRSVSQTRKMKSSSWSSDSFNKENLYKFNASDEIRKPVEKKLSQLPVMKSAKVVLNSRNGNQGFTLPLLTQKINVAESHKMSPNLSHKRTVLGYIDKENSLHS